MSPPPSARSAPGPQSGPLFLLPCPTGLAVRGPALGASGKRLLRMLVLAAELKSGPALRGVPSWCCTKRRWGPTLGSATSSGTTPSLSSRTSTSSTSPCAGGGCCCCTSRRVMMVQVGAAAAAAMPWKCPLSRSRRNFPAVCLLLFFFSSMHFFASLACEVRGLNGEPCFSCARCQDLGELASRLGRL